MWGRSHIAGSAARALTRQDPGHPPEFKDTLSVLKPWAVAVRPFRGFGAEHLPLAVGEFADFHQAAQVGGRGRHGAAEDAEGMGEVGWMRRSS